MRTYRRGLGRRCADGSPPHTIVEGFAEFCELQKERVFNNLFVSHIQSRVQALDKRRREHKLECDLEHEGTPVEELDFVKRGSV